MRKLITILLVALFICVNQSHAQTDTLVLQLPGSVSKILVFRGSNELSSTGRDYREYHLNRIKADKAIFVNKHYAEGLSIYRRLFKNYDFVFLSDCITALQIALFTNDEKAFVEIIEKATKNGLIPKHLLHIRYIKEHPLYTKSKEQVIALYKVNRKTYLSRLDTVALKKMYRLYAVDQMQKNPRQSEGQVIYKRRYKQELSQTIKELNTLLHEKGIPGEKIIGVDQNDVMTELKTGAPDIVQYYSLYRDMGRFSIDQMKLDELSFSTTVLVPVVVHFITDEGSKAVNELFSEDLYFRELAKGNIHPNDYAAFNDCAYLDDLNEPKTLDFSKGDRYFGVLGRIANFSKPDVDKLRIKYFLAPLDVAKAKTDFMKGQGMHWSFGWTGILSE